MVNIASDEAISAPQMLAIAYAPTLVQSRLRWLLRFDNRLQGILGRATEPIIAQMRLAWWRDTLRKAPQDRPKGEPLLAALHDLGPDPLIINASISLVDAVELGLDGGGLKERAGVICTTYAGWTDSDPDMAEKLALAWAGQSDAVMTSTRVLRPLSILALSEQLENGAVKPGIFGAGVRLNWHALTGR
jgi:hypothetical protein